MWDDEGELWSLPSQLPAPTVLSTLPHPTLQATQVSRRVTPEPQMPTAASVSCGVTEAGPAITHRGLSQSERWSKQKHRA